MKRKGAVRFALRSYVSFFVLSGFLITCCMLLFLASMVRETGLALAEPQIRHAARVTLINVLALTGVLTAVDAVRRHYTVARPVGRILAAARSP